jgi:molybdopterin molybdotransferase
MSSAPLLPVADAICAVLDATPVSRVARLPLAEVAGRILAAPVMSDLDMPPFDRSMMDGFAVRAGDAESAPVELRIVGVVHAGDAPETEIGPGQTMKIMTGAPLPPGADAVVMVERSELIGDDRVRLTEAAVPGRHIARRGEDVREGDVVLDPGILLGPSQISVLAAVGATEAEVIAPPRVAVLTTGDELVPPGVRPGPGQIRNSNSAGLVARLARDGAVAADLGIVPDTMDATRAAVRRAIKEYDVVLLTGGISMGDRDLVGGALRDEGVTTVFHKVNIKPGKPLFFGHRDGTLVFGLPGNPVSVAVTYEIFVRPALRKLMRRAPWSRRRREAVLTGAEIRSLPREQYLPAIVWRHAGLRVALVRSHGSGDLFSFARANALLVVPAGGPAPSGGEIAEVVLLDEAPDRPGAAEDA